MLTKWQCELKALRKAERWDDAFDLLDRVTHGLIGDELQRARYEYAYTRFSQQAQNAPESLEVVRVVLSAIHSDDELRALCLITGINYSLYACDMDVAKELVNAAGRLLSERSAAITQWKPHLHIWSAYYWQSRGNIRFAVKHLQDAVACTCDSEYMSCASKNGCAKRTAVSALGDALWLAGRREEAMRELRRALAMSNDDGKDAVAYLRGRIAHGEGRLPEAETQLRFALEVSNPRDHLFRLKAVTALVSVLSDGGRREEAAVLLQPYKEIAKKGWMTRVLVRLQRLLAPVAEKGGDLSDEVESG